MVPILRFVAGFSVAQNQKTSHNSHRTGEKDGLVTRCGSSRGADSVVRHDAGERAVMLKNSGPLIKAARNASGVTQRDLAAACSIDFTYVSKIESGKMPPPSDATIVCIADHLGIDRDALFVAFAKVPPDILIQLRGNAELTRQIREWIAQGDLAS